MHKPFKEFFYFSRAERRGILVLIGIIILVSFFGYAYSHWKQEQPLSEEELQRHAADAAEYEAFIASIQEKEQKRESRFAEYHKHPKGESPIVSLAPFDPNTADSAAFRQLGLPGWMARNILNYRNKGGKFRKADDFKKIYGLTEEQYQTLSPYIYITPEDTTRQTASLYNSPAAADSASTTKAAFYKYPAGTTVDLNLADTTELKKIPGIGSGIARLIVGYRLQLGGFYRIEQLQEIHLDYHQLKPWFSIDSSNIRLINLNRAGIERLRNHPYINFYQAKAFVEYRKKKGALTSLKPFSLYEEFTEEDLERISHYVSFE